MEATRETGGGEVNPYTVIIPSRTESNVHACASSFAARNVSDIGQWPALHVVANGELLEFCSLEFLDGMFLWHSMSRFEQNFNFAAAVNAGVRSVPPDHDLLLLNDDTRLLTPNGFDLLREAAYAHPECGLMFPSVTGCTGNREQITKPGGGVRYAKRHVVPFIGVYIRRTIWDEIGPLDEEFCVDYGWEDSWYCTLVRSAGYELGIFDGCVIEHGVLPSTYRSAGNCPMKENRKIYERKWGERFPGMPVLC